MVNDGQTLIRLQDISRHYRLGEVDIPALTSVNLTIRSGDFVAVTGPSGSGKTTMMNLIGLIDDPTTGQIFFDDTNVTGASDRELTALRLEKIGFIFQTFNLLAVLSVYENIEMPLLLADRPMPSKDRQNRVESLIEEVGLTEWARHKPSELSGGQRQRVAIARALVTQPKLIIADEPTANLDSETGRMILELMKSENRSRGTTFLFSTHDDAIRDLADHVITLKDGRITRDNLIVPVTGA